MHTIAPTSHVTPRDVPSGAALMARVQHVRARLRRAVSVRGLLLSTGALLAALLLRQVVMAAPIGPAARVVVQSAVLLATTWVMARWWYRWWRRRVDAVQAALWIEEQRGGRAEFALVTCVEALQSTDAPPVSVALVTAAQRTLDAVNTGAALRAHERRQWLGAGAFAMLAALLLLLAPSVQSETGSQNAVGTPARPGSATAAPLSRWQGRVIPPAYTALPPVTFGDVSTVQALSGSRVELTGDGAPPQVWQLRLADSSQTALGATAASDGWRLVVVATDSVGTMRVERGGRARLLVIEGHADSIPQVTLEAPARDSVFREARGRLPLAASLRDDIGLTTGRFELLVSSGEGERFTVRTVLLGAANWSTSAHTRTATLRATLDLAALALQPGDVVHVRAIARDGHPSATREFGSSETRAFRVARPSEYDSVAVEPAPPPEVDKSLLSQRMLLMLTEKLDRQRPRLARTDVLRESGRLARDQARLRQAVGDVVFQRLSGEPSGEHSHFAGDGHDHGVDVQGGKLALSGTNAGGVLEEGNDSPVIAINQPLLEAYNAMWDAGRALEQGDPHAAIPPMRRALDAIERSRAASRIYLRGRPPQVIVDIDKARLTGKDTGHTSPRTARAALPQRLAQRDARLVAAAVLATRDWPAARDSLTLLRVESLADAPAFAAALAGIIDMPNGTDASAAFTAARRVLGTVVRTTPSAWSRGVPR
jgi:hypothetical protein